MKRTMLFVAALAFAACTQNTGSGTANLIGTHDLVFIDQLGDGNTVSGIATDADGNESVNGIPGRFLFITSADTNELRVLELFRPNVLVRDWMRGPNPLETLSIPVLDRPTMLATDEGRNSAGQRVSSQTVYAARPGGAEVSIVSLTTRRQLGGRPVPVPAPVVAIGAWMDVVDDQLPAASKLYVATWDGDSSTVYAATVSNDPSVVDAQVCEGTLDFTRLTTIAGLPLSAMFVVSPLASRTLDGAPFCATEVCLALATRQGSSGGGDEWLFEPSTGRSVKLGFSGPVRKFASGWASRRLYALLDEVACGGPQCGGVIAVDLISATSRDGFARSKDILGRDFGPIRVTEGLMTGLAIAQGGLIRQLAEYSDGGATSIASVYQRYDELGAFASSDGLITYFSGASGSLIDYDGRRATFAGAAIRLPGVFEDGGVSFSTEDGGTAGSFTTVDLTASGNLDETWRSATVTSGAEPDAVNWSLEVSDGYFVSQDFSAIYNGFLPGLVNLTPPTSGTDITAGGFEVRAAPQDLAIFFDENYLECGRSTVTAIGSGVVTVAAIPCAATWVSIRAAGAQPMVMAGSVEGYLGRSALGTAFTYNRPLLFAPADVIGTRTALTINVPANPSKLEGAYTTFSLDSYFTPLRFQIDVSSSGLSGCQTSLISQVVFGNLVIRQAPGPVNGQLSFQWETWSVVPSSNGVFNVQNITVRAGGLPLTGADYAACRR